METIMPAIIGTLLLAGLVGGTRRLLRDWFAQRRQRSGGDQILLAFPIEADWGRGRDDLEPPFKSAAPERGVTASDTPSTAIEEGVPASGRPQPDWASQLPLAPASSGPASPASVAAAADEDDREPLRAEEEMVAEDSAFDTGEPDFGAAESVFNSQRGSPSARPVGFVSAEPSLASAASRASEEQLERPDRGGLSASEDTNFPGANELELIEGRTLRFHKADSRTMRLLPGRLEVEDGEESRAEVRFVDLPGQRPEVTFGRSPGEPLRHVQLRSATVSRQHARLVRDGTDWVIANLSHTNPIVINGVQLARPEEQRTLEDGDRIEMGEVVFRYYAL
jgi:hypothetical protein